MSPSPYATPLHAALRACLGSFGLVLAYSCGYNLLLLATPLYLLQIYDRVLSSRSVDTLVMLTAIVATTVVVGGLLDAFRRIVLGRIGAWLDDRTRPLVVEAALACAAAGQQGRATEAYRDFAAVAQFVESSACPILFDALWSPFFIAVLFLLDPLLGLAGAGCVLVIFAVTAAGEMATGAPASRAGAQFARSYGRLGVSVSHIGLLRAMGAREGALSQILAEADDAKREQDIARRRGETVMLLAKPARALAQIVVMGLAAWLVLQHGKSPAIIFAASLLFGRGMGPVEGLVAGWKSFAGAASAFRRISSVLRDHGGGEAARPRAAAAEEGALVLDNVGLTLPSASCPVLKTISLRLEPGECLGIIGLSGSGKSMLGKVIAGMVPPTEGEIRFGGVSLRERQDIPGARAVGYLPQEIDLVGRTVADIIGRLGSAMPEDVVAAAKLAGIHETIDRLPKAYDSDVADGDLVLLRGHRQRLGLARALCGNPALVVLDEPNASLDFLGERMLFDAVESLKARRTIVVVITHRTGILGAADKIAIMQNGSVSAFGGRDEIFARYLHRPQAGMHEPEPTRITPPEIDERSRTSRPESSAQRAPA